MVRGVNWVGDTILSYPTVQRLKTAFSDCHLAILVPHHLVDLWKTFPYVDEIIPFEKKGGLGSFWEDLKIGHSIRRRMFDLAIILPRSFRSAFQIYLAKIPIRIGYKGVGRSFFLTHPLQRKGEVLSIHRVHYYQRLIDPLGVPDVVTSPRIFLREEDRNLARNYLEGLGLLNGKVLIGFNPGATYGLAKCWAPSRFGELGRRLVEKWDASILIFGRREEMPIAREILDHLKGGGIDLTGKTELLHLAALLERCNLLVTNDTGTMHMATAVGTSVVAIFGSTDAKTTGPWGEGHRVIRKDVACSPCLKRLCPTDHRCMELITVDEVEEVVENQLRSLLSKKTPGNLRYGGI